MTAPAVTPLCDQEPCTAPPAAGSHLCLRHEDGFTSTVDAAAAHARILWLDEPHPLDCRCRDCIADELGPEDYR